MFLEKVLWGTIGGGVLGILAMIAQLKEHKPWSEALGAVPGMMLVGIIFVFWVMKDRGGDMNNSSSTTDISRLRNRLSNALQTAASNEAAGNHQAAAYWRGEAAVIESQLRSFGA